MTTDKGRRLGRGLEALLARTPAKLETPAPASTSTAPGAPTADDTPSNGALTPATGRGGSAAPDTPFRPLPLAQIRPNPLQPRKEFKAEDLADLEASLRVSGLLQPVTVRPAPQGGGYELIAGERRFRAAQRLGWTEIPAIVRDVDEKTLLSLAMVENLQRADLNPIEEAEGYQQLITDFTLTQQEVADIVGKDRSTVANMLRLLALPASVRRMVREGQLSVGHARALLGIGDETRIADVARSAIAEGWSVREVERQVREASPKGAKAKGESKTSAATTPDLRSAEVRRVEDLIRKRLGTDTKVVQTGTNAGEIRLSFYTADDFERLAELLIGGPLDGED
ncbi:MAG: ParB/RepB/Spo0J family partition protein [Gemmatimonadaceae bacterium]